MSLRALPIIELLANEDGDEFETPVGTTKEWSKFAGVQLAAAPEGAVIDIFDEIGFDPMTGSTTSRMVREKLASAGAEAPVTVNINSPGGSFYEGNGAYSALAMHKGKVTVNILGIAASAASLIAMAGDRINIVENGSVFVHNAQGVTMGDRHMHEEAVGMLAGIDAALKGVYAKRTGRAESTIAKMMDAETWFWGKDAVHNGFADGILASNFVKIERRADDGEVIRPQDARRQIELALAKREGMPRGLRRKLINAISEGTPRATSDPATLDAGLSAIADDLRRLFPT